VRIFQLFYDISSTQLSYVNYILTANTKRLDKDTTVIFLVVTFVLLAKPSVDRHLFLFLQMRLCLIELVG